MVEKEVKSASNKTKPEKPKSTADLLLENFISLQRIMADLAIKTSRLNNQLSKLLELFEEAAKSFKERKKTEYEEEKTIAKPSDELTNKIDRLIDQNKTIARGLSLIGQASLTREVGSEKSEESSEEGDEKENIKAKPLPEVKF